MDRHGASEAKSEFEAGTSFYFEEAIYIKVSPSVGRRVALDGSAKVTEGGHMRFAEYASRIIALLQEDMAWGSVRPALEAIGLPPCVLM